MFTKLKKTGQSTLEYALVIAVIVAALVAMQTYIKRGVQGKLKANTDEVGEQFSAGASTYDYTTTSKAQSSETVYSGMSTADRGGNTLTDTQQEQNRSGTEKVQVYNDANEYWVK
jgi:Flp pilus assembly pilin Flp